MNEKEITALAREYAEEMHYGDDYFESENKRFLTWLTRRFFLVEKSRCKEIYQEAKERYFNPDSDVEKTMYGGRMSLLEYLFTDLGKEMEGEEMLTVPRSAVIAEMDKLHKYSYQMPHLQLGLNALTALFGSKCLPDEPSKLQASCRQVKEPNGTIVGTIDDTKGPDYSNATETGKDCNVDSAHHFADAGKMVDHIADVSNMVPSRLHIAAMAMQGMLSNPEFGKKYLDYLHCCRKGDDVIDETLYYAQKALNIADTLIAETVSSAQPLCTAKKGDNDEND